MGQHTGNARIKGSPELSLAVFAIVALVAYVVV